MWPFEIIRKNIWKGGSPKLVKSLKDLFEIEYLTKREAFIFGMLLALLVVIFTLSGWIAWENMRYLGWV